MKSINPATGEVLKTHVADDSTAVNEQLRRSNQAFESWRERPIENREELLSNVATVLRKNIDTYATQITNEIGKPRDQAISEVEKCAWVCEYYAEHASEQLEDRRIGTEPGTKTYISYEPLGVILAIMPWNYPFWQVFRFAAPHLTAGNVGVLKHAPNAFGCARAIEDIFQRAGYPDDVFASVQTTTEQVSAMIADERIRAVTLTGSTEAGRAVAEQSARELKPTVLELGGSDPFLVLDDADIEQAASVGVRARTQNGGQSCIAAKRFIVHEAIYDEFVETFTERMDNLEVGDPTADNTDVGPQAREDLLMDLHQQVTRTIEAGATRRLGGEPLDRPGYYYPPTVLTDVPDDTPAANKELFGPVATVFKANSVEELVACANDTSYGLGASIWTSDTARGESVARDIEAGSVFINELVKSDPRVPFGGIKDSGYGSELSTEGIREFVNEKVVWVES